MNLKALQKKWYKKLQQEGFIDIEDTSSPREYLKSWHSTRFIKDFTPDSARERFEYYNRASQFLHEYRFKNRTEKQVWQYHSEGYYLREIAKQCQLSLGGSEISVHSIVKRLRQIMKTWEFESE